jgi:hypothetical protein
MEFGLESYEWDEEEIRIKKLRKKDSQMLLNFIEVTLFIFYLQLFNIIDLGLGTGGVSII